MAFLRIGALAAALFLLFPPAGAWGAYSQLEVALGLLAVAIATSREGGNRAYVPSILVVLLGLMLVSAVWSTASWTSIRDATTYAVLALAAILLVRVLSPAEVAWAVLAMGSIALATSVVARLVSPETAIDSWNLLQGIYGNRNSLGYVLVQAVPAVIAVPLRFRGAFVVRLLGLGAFFWGIAQTGAKTALISAVVVVLAWGAMLLIRKSTRYLWAIGALVVATGAAIVFNLSRVLEILGKDATGSGRTEIWAAILPSIAGNPIFGTGWAMSWPVGSPQYTAVLEALGVPLFHAHNEVLNWFVTTGIVGLILVVALYGFTAWTGWTAFKAEAPGSAFIALSLAMIVVRGFTEISETSAQGWLVLMLAAALGARHLGLSGRAVPRTVLLVFPRKREL